MKVLMGYCGFEAFKTLVINYLEVKEHALFAEIERKLIDRITQAQMAEVFTRNHEWASV
ncbi:hypothetical protein F2Q68_00028358 [Brassica cretica]|uniref:AAA+ ATPase At3g28540-like C-terminal domain-containing protein n=2 Tax=Brassica cretica TaxID=69181 RepID=A0ABQ7DZV9_BRACR|nr:hypothetical protein F2Q68_00028358 [Brassica cretica]KAF3582925.1 hypothetical protein DY000_02035933 [Brassica cretica]